MIRFINVTCICLLLMGLYSSCDDSVRESAAANTTNQPSKVNTENTRMLSQEFTDYWYSGVAEITSYKLSQERYGELRDGTAVCVFVTEDFLPKEQVKADSYSEENIAVLKLNLTKKFNTGIYPYSIMTSTFSPVKSNEHPLKITNSVQEWCGQVFMQLNNRDKYEMVSHSYFADEGDRKLSMPKTWLENEIWNLIRLNPEELPTGEIEMVPAFEYLRLRHKTPKAYSAVGSIMQGDSLSSYTLTYPNLQRELIIYFESKFPFEIEKWEEMSAPWTKNGPSLKTTATKIKRLKSAYWGQNSNKYLALSDSLGLRRIE